MTSEKKPIAQSGEDQGVPSFFLNLFNSSKRNTVIVNEFNQGERQVSATPQPSDSSIKCAPSSLSSPSSPAFTSGLAELHSKLWKFQPGVEAVLPTLSKKEIQRQECIHEFITSERQYVKDLEFIIKNIYNKLKKLQVLTLEETNQIFGRITEIHKCNEKFLTELDDFQKQEFPLYNDISVVCFPFFEKLYDNYHEQIETINESNMKILALKENEVFTSFMNALAYSHNSSVDKLGLNAYVIRPLQRITKYPLLIREILHYTDESHNSYKNMLKLQDVVNDAVNGINAYSKKVGTNKAALKKIDFKDCPFSVTAPRDAELLQEQYILVKTEVKKREKIVYCFLFDKYILFAQAKKKTEFVPSLKRSSSLMGTSLAARRRPDPTTTTRRKRSTAEDIHLKWMTALIPFDQTVNAFLGENGTKLIFEFTCEASQRSITLTTDKENHVNHDIYYPLKNIYDAYYRQ